VTEPDPPSHVVHPSGVIPQGLVDKVVGRRRGRLHMYPTLDGPRTALVVVDMDQHSVGRSEQGERLCRVVNSLAAAVRAAGGVVAFVTTRIDPARLALSLGDELAEEYRRENHPGGDGVRPASCLDVDPGDLRAVKVRASAFFPGNCDLPDRLAARGIVHVLVAGLVTSVCCESSARDACELGYQVTMVSDALGGQSWGVHEASLAVFFRNFGDVRPSHEVIRLVGASDAASPVDSGASGQPSTR
jgi:ureidoacrylate peracid hydrolase